MLNSLSIYKREANFKLYFYTEVLKKYQIPPALVAPSFRGERSLRKR